MDNYYELAATNFREGIAALGRKPNREDPTTCLLYGLAHLAQGLLEERRILESRLAAIEGALPPQQ